MSFSAKINSVKIYTLGVKKFAGAIHLPIIQTIFVPQNIDYDKYKLLLFTSQIAISNALKDLEKWRDKSVICIGEASETLLQNAKVTHIFTPKISNASSLINEFCSLIATQKTLYIRGEKIATDIKKALAKKDILIDEIITYQTHCNKISNPQLSEKPESGSYIILSSPFIVQCFMQKYNLSDYQLIAIGKKTASFIPKTISYSLSETTNIEKIIQKLQKN